MAFGHAPYARLAVVYLPNVTSIGRDAFRRNEYLVKVNLSRAVTVEDYAFDDTSRLEHFAAPALESIGRHALDDTHALRAVHLPNLRYMGINCFDLCRSCGCPSWRSWTRRRHGTRRAPRGRRRTTAPSAGPAGRPAAPASAAGAGSGAPGAARP
ncbi:leucine-rich repeat protein [Dactylosporangium sp. NPDC049140]|uniref:leucine-rich repeat protein n=1 Tax=Dactylosporangium sp. NPDC049140 TaxID=3155647 RepID=UPI0033F232D0